MLAIQGFSNIQLSISISYLTLINMNMNFLNKKFSLSTNIKKNKRVSILMAELALVATLIFFLSLQQRNQDNVVGNEIISVSGFCP